MLVAKIIGAGRIATPVVRFLQATDGFELGAVLSRSGGKRADVVLDTDPDRFSTGHADIVIDAAGPTALRSYGIRALAAGHLWSVSASALADQEYRTLLEDQARAHGRHVRLFSNGMAATSPDGTGHLSLIASRPNMGGDPDMRWSGSVDEAARSYPNEVNFAMAAALAGSGADVSRIELADSGSDGQHSVAMTLTDGRGTISRRVAFDRSGGDHPVALAIIAALRREIGVYRFD